MSMIWAGAVEIALAWAVILGVKIASNAFEWKFEHLLPNYWYPVVKRKLAKPETATLKDKGIPKKISDELEGLLAFMQGGSLQNSRIRMDRTFQDKIEHETKQLKKRGLARQFHFTNLKLSEKNEKKKDFRHWSDAGREWREVIVEASVSDKYLSKDKKKVLHETIYPYGAILLRQSRHIRHTDKADKDRKKEQTFYSEYSQMTCPSCGAQLNLKGNETNCPYCGAFIQSQFYDWQTEDFRIYHLPDPNVRNLLYTGGLILALFLPAVPCIRFISNMYLAFGLAFVLTILVAFGMLSFITPKLEKEEKLKEQIVRYDESWLASNINEALYKSVLTPELLTYIVDDIKIKSVENTEDTTTISVSAKLRRTILENDQHIVAKNEKENWTLSRALHPNRLKSKGQDIVIEKECPSCGANYVPDEKGCCSYCGYSLKVDNSKWKINASEKRNMSTIV